MSKKMVSKEKVLTEANLLRSKIASNKMHLQEIQLKAQRLKESHEQLTKKIHQQEQRLEELQALLQRFGS